MTEELKLTAAQQKIIADLKEVEENEEPKKTLKDRLKWIGDLGWMENEAPKRDYVFMQPNKFGKLVGFLPKGKTAMLISPGGVGKTFALIQCAISAATGGKWFGTYQAAKPSKVMLVTAEEDRIELWGRIRGIVSALEIDKEPHLIKLIRENIAVLPLCGISCRFSDNNGPTKEFKELKSLLEENDGMDLLILDPASYFMGHDCEVDNAAATDWITLLNQLAKTKGKPAVLVAHHTNKSAINSGSITQALARGATALVDGVRWVAALQRKSEEEVNKIIFKLVKSNHCYIPEQLELERDVKNGGMLKPSVAKTSDEDSIYKQPQQQTNHVNGSTKGQYGQ